MKRNLLLLALSALLAWAAPVRAADVKVSTAPAAGWRETVRSFAENTLKHPAWGYSHSVRVYKLAVELAGEDKVRLDDDVMFAAAYLHDMGAFAPYTKQTEDHADTSVAQIETVLSATDFPKAKLDAVRSAIRTHMYQRKPEGNEAVYLHDADALDWLGAVGAARVLALIDKNGGAPNGAMAVQFIEDNLSKVPAQVFSRAGKARVPDRVQELKTFVGQLRGETADLKDF